MRCCVRMLCRTRSWRGSKETGRGPGKGLVAHQPDAIATFSRAAGSFALSTESVCKGRGGPTVPSHAPQNGATGDFEPGRSEKGGTTESVGKGQCQRLVMGCGPRDVRMRKEATSHSTASSLVVRGGWQRSSASWAAPAEWAHALLLARAAEATHAPAVQTGSSALAYSWEARRSCCLLRQRRL